MSSGLTYFGLPIVFWLRFGEVATIVAIILSVIIIIGIYRDKRK